MKPVYAFLYLSLAGLILLQCSPATREAQKDTMIDTVVVRDTVMVGGKHLFASATKMNVLYTGVDNPIHLDLSGIDPDEVQVELVGGLNSGAIEQRAH